MASGISKFLIDIGVKGAKKSSKEVKSLGASMKSMAVKVAGATAAVYAVNKAITAAFELARESAKVEQLARGFDNLGKQFGFNTTSLGKLRKAVNGTVDDMSLMQQANNAMMLGVVKSDEEMAQLFDTAQRLGQALGVDTASAVNSLVTGMGRQSKLMLDNLGIMVDMNTAYENFAVANNTTVAAMTDAEKKTAFNNETMRKAAELTDELGAEVLGTAEKLAQMDTAVTQAKVAIGEALSPVIVDMAKFFGTAAIKVGEFFRGFTQSPLEKQIADMKAMGLETKNLEIQLNRINQEKAQAQLTKEFEKEGHARSVITDNTVLQVHLMEKEAELLSKTTALTGNKMDIFEYQIALMQNRLEFENEAARDEAFNAANAIILEQRRIDKAQEHNDGRIEQARQQEEISLHLQALKLQEAELTKTTNDEAIAGNEAVVESNKAVELSTKERIKLKLQELAKEGDADKLQEKLAKNLVGRSKEKNQLLVESFITSKGMKIKEASADAAAMASKAYKSLAVIPIVGPALGALAGAAAFAFGMKQVGIIKSFATGGSFTTSGPELIMVGDNPSGREQVDVTPLGVNEAATGGGQNIVLNISNPIMTDTFVEESIIPSIREGLRLGESLD